MPESKLTFERIQKEITDNRNILDQIHRAQLAVRGYQTRPSMLFTAELAPAGHRSFRLLAQGDSWFDYPPGTDIIDCLHDEYNHTIVNIAVAGSTLNDEAYGPVPRELFGLPFGPQQSDDPSRIAELLYRIQEDSPQALLLDGGGNDVAGDEFFSFINNARSGLPSVNQQVLDGTIIPTLQTAYEYVIDNVLTAAPTMKIFIHGYDYPWPDGRGLIDFLGWRVGPSVRPEAGLCVLWG